MTRDEILKQSRKENTGLDEREQQVRAKGGDIAGRVMLSVGVFLSFLCETKDGPALVHHVVWLMVMAHYAVAYGYEAYHLKKRSWWIWVTFCAATFLFYLYLFLKAIFGW